MKKIIVLIIINLFILNGVSYAAIDCTNPEKMSEKLKCKLTAGKKDISGKEKKKIFKFKNPFKTVNEWSEKNKTLSDLGKN